MKPTSRPEDQKKNTLVATESYSNQLLVTFYPQKHGSLKLGDKNTQ